MTTFDLQGHRGARGLRPENTLPSFEFAFDAGVTSVETDLHLTRDGAVVLCHDPILTAPPFSPAPSGRFAVRGLTLAELRQYRAADNPAPGRFPQQRPEVGPVSRLYAEQHGLDPFAVPTLADLFGLAAAYAGEAGRRAGKSAEQRERAARVVFDLELKRSPFHPEAIGDGFDGEAPALLERALLDAVRAAGVVGGTAVRSFDHRSVRALVCAEPGLRGGVLIAHTAPVAPEEVVRAAGAQVYCPSYEFVDEGLVRRLHAAGLHVVPYTVNEPEAWERLLAWGVDGICTDYPDRLGAWLRERRVAF
jgi:glycerophosphoryl diester phosphodiesterase